MTNIFIRLFLNEGLTLPLMGKIKDVCFESDTILEYEWEQRKSSVLD